MDGDLENELNPDEILEAASKATLNLLPEKSKERYERNYNTFIKWCDTKKVKRTHEDVLIAFFAEKSQTLKALWSLYSTIKTCLSIKRNIDISQYYKLIAILKRKSTGYKPKKAKVDIRNVGPNNTLNTYLRENLLLTGTKRMCLEGGCGLCVVTILRRHPVHAGIEILAVNSCLVSILSCSDWKVYTIEGIGNSRKTHAIQEVLVKFNGSQCGYCTPGMIMNAFSLKLAKEKLSMKDIENSFGGNICRCTGYRPILSAFKSMCYDASSDLVGLYPDIEDIKPCKGSCNEIGNRSTSFYFSMDNNIWINVRSLNDLFEVMKTFKGQNNGNYYETGFALVAGNTARGVYKNTAVVNVYVDILNINELRDIKINENVLIIGANTTLTEAMEAFQDVADSNEKFKHLKKMAFHIDLIANVPVRNIGTLAGNLMIKHQHKEFPSDIFLILETFKAELLILDTNRRKYWRKPSDFLSMDMSDKIIEKIKIPSLDKTYKYETYKIMPRAQNAHALVNAGFLFKFNNGQICEANIVYGCINKQFVHAKKTEKFLNNKNICENQVLQETFRILEKELDCDHVLPEPRPEFRKRLAIALFYKFVLSITPEKLLPKRVVIGRRILERPLSSPVSREFDSKVALYPLTKSIPKTEAKAQVTGEAEYIMDIPDVPNQCYAAFVLAKAPANSKILEVIASKATDMKDVFAYFDKNSIPGKNTFTPKQCFFITIEEELFCSGIVKYFHQPIGIVIAKSHEIANQAADMVEVKYELSDKKPLVTIQNILDQKNNDKMNLHKTIEAKCKGGDSNQFITGTYDMFWQYHFHMETQCCSAIPKEDGIDLYAGTQWMDLTQNSAATVLDIPANKVNVFVRRLGGAFGAKIYHSSMVSSAAALAAHLLRLPVKIWLPLETNMNVIGKRHPIHSNYEVGLKNNGEIQYLNNTFYYDEGCGGNGVYMPLLFDTYLAAYNTERWCSQAYSTKSDTHGNAFTRAPASEHGLGMVESIMDHCAMSIGMDPLEFRLKNLKEGEIQLLEHIEEFRKWADIDFRKRNIKTFNQENKWRKKGLSVVPMIYPFAHFFGYGVIVSIYHHDGSVSIAHGGVEIGQGINTKVMQVCAHKLGIPLEKVSVKPSNNLTAPNSSMTGASITSEGVCWATLKACDILLERMEKVRRKMENPKWEDLVNKCYEEFVDLCATSMCQGLKEDKLKPYKVYAVCASEIELDVLTGQYQISRVDLLEDAGQSLNPAIDIGQVEGAFVMGLGFYTSEQMITKRNGEILTNRTWNYKPPGAKDIPVDFRIKFTENSNNPVGVLHSKAVGEPPFCLAVSIPLAVRQAIAAVRHELNVKMPQWCPFDGPSTVENTFTNCFVDYEQFTL